MARIHGKDCRVYLGARDASGDIVSITPKGTSQALDTTTVGDDWEEATAGLKGWEAPFEAFYDSAAGEIGRQLETPGDSFIVTIGDGDADAVGDNAMVFPAGILDSRAMPITAADMVKLNCTLKGSGRCSFVAKILHPLGQETGTASTASVDNTASSANGGRGNLHVTAITGTWTIVIEESSSDGGGDPWASKCAFTQVAAAGGATSETKEVTGTVERYLRVTATEDVAGSITFVVAFGRY